jgi:small subunit ribosomal protein S9
MPIKKNVKIEESIVKDEQKAKKEISKKPKFLYAVGKRKTSTARVRLYPKSNDKKIIINQKNIDEYFTFFDHQKKITEPLKLTGLENKIHLTIKVKGGGLQGQAEAIRHGVAKILLILNPDYKKILKSKGYLTRDSRKKERKKPGLKRARRAPQWQKR